MAHHHVDREDLLREATALVERIELAPVCGDGRPHVTAGFRASGSASVFFGAEPVYQFNARGELRRAYRDELLFKAERGRLVSLRRIRKQGLSQLLRHELSDVEQHAFLAHMRDTLQRFENELTREEFTVIGQVPPVADVLGRLREWLARHRVATIAESPHA